MSSAEHEKIQIHIHITQNSNRGLAIKAVHLEGCADSKPVKRRELSEHQARCLDVVFLNIAAASMKWQQDPGSDHIVKWSSPEIGDEPLSKAWSDLNRGPMVAKWIAFLGFTVSDSKTGRRTSYGLTDRERGSQKELHKTTKLKHLFKVVKDGLLLEDQYFKNDLPIVVKIIGTDESEIDPSSVLSQQVGRVSSQPVTLRLEGVYEDAAESYHAVGSVIKLNGSQFRDSLFEEARGRNAKELLKNSSKQLPLHQSMNQGRAVLFVYSGFSSRLLIERLLENGYCVDVYLIDPRQMGRASGIDRRMVEGFINTDMWVWASNRAYLASELTLYLCPPEFSDLQHVFVERVAVIKSSYAQARDVLDHSRKYSHNSEHKVIPVDESDTWESDQEFWSHRDSLIAKHGKPEQFAKLSENRHYLQKHGAPGEPVSLRATDEA